MKILSCPINGPRPMSEFAYGGELREMPDPGRSTDLEWTDYVFNHNSVPGVKREWWCHTSSGVWFVAERDTGSDEVLRTYLFRPPAGGSA
ncbi:MAG: sarcosine oxidase subunit delta [Steroidobacterales bacterium]